MLYVQTHYFKGPLLRLKREDFINQQMVKWFVNNLFFLPYPVHYETLVPGKQNT